jgi:hypothetical protein
MIRSEHIKSCLTAQTRFMLFKGPGSFKINFKIGGNVDELKAYRLIPLTPPPPPFECVTFSGKRKKGELHSLLFHFTLPLRSQESIPSPAEGTTILFES